MVPLALTELRNLKWDRTASLRLRARSYYHCLSLRGNRIQGHQAEAGTLAGLATRVGFTEKTATATDGA